MVLGTVLRSHAGGYIVHQNDLRIDLFCAARGRLKKESVSIFTGDKVELDEINCEQATAVIAARLDRTNLLSRPPLANVDQVVIVQAIRQPEWNPLWCDRHLVHFQLEIPSAQFVLCFNKSDLANADEVLALRSIYEPLGYIVIVVSARTGDGVVALEAQLKGKISVLAGPSGVGKSSLLNTLNTRLNLKTGLMENEFGVGRHTTTASELYRLSADEDQTPTWVADTPGFSISELSHPEPGDLAAHFPEILALGENCKYSDCLHLDDQGCNVREHLDEIDAERYGSYVCLVGEAQAGQKFRKETSTKVESKVKLVGGKENAKSVPRLNNRYRAPSRRTEKQQFIVTKIDDLEDEDEHDLEGN